MRVLASVMILGGLLSFSGVTLKSFIESDSSASASDINSVSYSLMLKF